ncbi:hypothetical protein GCM10010156_38550 [Planobispora rosea]|uniref:histidine kinase n=1 Tax=Planobispora rosea TaxID=35762 RepID=A0A8J3SAG9_PLARO|nr:ATP-binding protein [Planobispora rosea]GGS76093.1 hypothetical protein GCM10010156_38550 [Planobispora rosea]GIH86263.1 hypothetical protein Pro02_46710 [Planobispora rosea]
MRFGPYRMVSFDGCSFLKAPDTNRNRTWLGSASHGGYPLDVAGAHALPTAAHGDGRRRRIPARHRPGEHRAIFTGFHRAADATAYSGTGLGLAICQRVVERHGGTIITGDNPGGGARFTFSLPAASS